MLGWILVVVTCAQDPIVKDWVEAGGDRAHPNAVVVSGTAELSSRDAYASALERAQESARERLRECGARRIEQCRPFWIPPFVTDRVLDEWLSGQDLRRDLEPRVLDRDEKVRDHGFGKSYQTWLLVDPEPVTSRAAEAKLMRELSRSGKLFVMKCGGTVLLWGFLALVGGWLDRLTRGYMTWRLRLIGLALGAAIPSIAFLA